MMITWPNKSKCVVALSFDVDGVSSAMNQNPETARLPSCMSMREYGPSVAECSPCASQSSNIEPQ